jgi:uncharacterized SAM-binding protein YcdF (DUF218 family)
MSPQEIAKILINPFVAVFFCLLLLLFKRKFHKGHLFLFALLLYGVSIPLPAKIIGWNWSVADTRDQDRIYDYAVILSGMVDWKWYADQEGAKPELRCYHRFGENADRIMAGLQLLQTGGAKKLLLGKLVHRGVNEAEIIADFLEHQGVGSEQYVIYGPVNNTLEEAIGVKNFSEEHQMESLLLITSEGHMRRAAALFAGQGLSPALFSVSRGDEKIRLTDFVPSFQGVAVNRKIFYELVGYAGYYLQGEI